MAMRAIVAILSAASVASSMELTNATWDAAVSGKTLFVKFFAPKCHHCKDMKPAWDQLMAEYKDSKTTLVADVDCTAGGESLCEDHGVDEYPDIRYGEPEVLIGGNFVPSTLHNYNGNRSLDDLKKFVEEKLGPRCGPKSLDLCDDAKKARIAEFTEMAKHSVGSKDLHAKIKRENKKVKDRMKEHEKIVEGLQKQGAEARKKTDEDIKEIEKKHSGLVLMKAVAAHEKSQAGGAADKKEL